MLIRENGQRITLLRAAPSEIKGVRAKRNPERLTATTRLQRHTVIGVFRVDDGVPGEVLAALSSRERQALARWLEAFHESRARAAAAPVLAHARSRLDELVRALEVAADTLSRPDADAIWERLHAVSRSLRQAGHARPALGKIPPLSVPGERDLVDELEAGDTSPPASTNDVSQPLQCQD